MQLLSVFVVLLFAAIVAGCFLSWDRRTPEERRSASRGDRRADGGVADSTEHPQASPSP